MIFGKLKLVTIESSVVKNRYLIYIDEMIKKIKEITNEGLCIFEDNTSVPISIASKTVVKFLVEFNNKDYSISRDTYDSVIEHLNMLEPTTQIPFYNYFYEGHSFSIPGKLESIVKNVKPKTTVIITDINIIDKHLLYDKNNRLASVIKVENYQYTLQLNNGKTIICKRNSFSLTESANEMILFKTLCPLCRR